MKLTPIMCALVNCCLLSNVLADDGVNLFEQYDQVEKRDEKTHPVIPQELRDAYTGFVSARKADNSAVHCLPGVEIPQENKLERAKLDRRGIVPPIVRERFASQVMIARKERDDCFLLRTNSTAIWFVQNKSGVWKVYRYLDKPIK